MYHRESRLPSVFLFFLGIAVSEQLQDLQTKCCFCYFTKCTIHTLIYLYKKMLNYSQLNCSIQNLSALHILYNNQSSSRDDASSVACGDNASVF